MSFRNNFFDSVQTLSPLDPLSFKDAALIGTVDRGLSANLNQLELMNATFLEAATQYREAADEASQSAAAEIVFQGEMNRIAILEAAGGIQTSIEKLGAYLGAGISELRWALEENTAVTQSILNSLWESHSIDSKQSFNEGVRCYECDERELARECFLKAVEACRTNGFAYQYLGFLAVHDDNQPQALRNFELAAKFAPNKHHKAIAHYHLARALHAADDKAGALTQIRRAVSLAPQNSVYRFELVHALMRVNSVPEAIQELRNLIAADLKYWTAAYIDRTLDPMRKDITALLNEMREEEKRQAQRVLADFLQSIRMVESLPEPLQFEYHPSSEWQAKMAVLFAQKTVFAYREVCTQVSECHLPFLGMVVSVYRRGIADAGESIAPLIAAKKKGIDEIRARISSLNEQKANASYSFICERDKINDAYKSTDKGKGCVAGCTGLMAIFGLLVWSGIVLSHADLRLLLVYAPLVLLYPAWKVAVKLVHLGRMGNLQREKKSTDSKLTLKIELLESAASKAEKEANFEVALAETELQRIVAIYKAHLDKIEKRLMELVGRV